MSGISKQEFNQFKAQLMAQLCELKTCGSCCDNKEEKLVREVTVSGNTFFVTYNDGTVKTFTIGSTGGSNPVFVTNIDVTPAGYLVFYSDGSNELLPSSSNDEMVKISNSDTNSKFLEDALTIKGTAGLTDPMLVKLNTGANEKLEINIPKFEFNYYNIEYSNQELNDILKLKNFGDDIVNIPQILDSSVFYDNYFSSEMIIDKFNKQTTIIGSFVIRISNKFWANQGFLNPLFLYNNTKLIANIPIYDINQNLPSHRVGSATFNVFDFERNIIDDEFGLNLKSYNKFTNATAKVITTTPGSGRLILESDLNDNVLSNYELVNLNDTLLTKVKYDSRPYELTFTFNVTYNNNY